MASPAGAHDIPNARVDRAIQVTLRPGRLEIDYEVSLAELTLAQDLRSLIGAIPAGIATRQDLYHRYAAETGALNARGFLASVDGRPLELDYEGHDLFIEEHPRFNFHLAAPLPDQGRLAILDTNYVASEGVSRLALRSAADIAVAGYDGPTDLVDVPERPLWMLTDEEERRTKQVEVYFQRVLAQSVADVTDTSMAPRVTSSNPVLSKVAGPGRWSIGRGLGGLLDRAAGMSWLGLGGLAFFLGAAHAVQPGHGKTLVAAASLGEGGRWWRGVLLAIFTTVAHISSVVAIAAGLWITQSTRYGSIQAPLAGIAGFLIAAVGVWRLGRHLGGHGEHGQPGVNGSEEFVLAPPQGLRSLLGLGLAGGLVPCWDAVLLILLAHALGRLALGLVLLGAFSAGMAAVLVAVGLAVTRVGGRFARRDREGRWERRLGLLSGLVLAGIGLAMLATA